VLITTTNEAAAKPTLAGTGAGLEAGRAAPGRLRQAFSRAKTTFDEGESLWTPVMILAIGYAIVVPVFLVMLALDLVASYVAGG
jgi:hypothetical protein